MKLVRDIVRKWELYWHRYNKWVSHLAMDKMGDLLANDTDPELSALGMTLRDHRIAEFVADWEDRRFLLPFSPKRWKFNDQLRSNFMDLFEVVYEEYKKREKYDIAGYMLRVAKNLEKNNPSFKIVN